MFAYLIGKAYISVYISHVLDYWGLNMFLYVYVN